MLSQTPAHLNDLNKFGILLFFLISAAILLRKRKNIFHYNLVATLVCCAFLITENVNINDKGEFLHPVLAGLSIPLTYLLAPLIYIFVNEVFISKEKKAAGSPPS